MQDHHRLQVYATSLELAIEVYGVARQLPDFERFGLANQLRRAAVSVGSNIAEGCGRTTPKELLLYLGNALASCNEIEFQLALATGSALVPAEAVATARRLLTREQRMLIGLMGTVRRRNERRAQ